MSDSVPPSGVVNLADFRDYCVGSLVCALCGSSYKAVWPASLDFGSAKCDHCGESGGFAKPVRVLIGAFVQYDIQGTAQRIEVEE